MSSELSGVLACAIVLLSCIPPGRAAVRLLPVEIALPRRFLELPLGMIVFLISFSLVSKIFPGYAVALPLSVLLPCIVSRLSTGGPARCRISKDDAICCSIFLAVAALTLYLHGSWPAIQWENSSDRAGVEKLFNLSLNQSFLFGEGFPPEWIWLGGEKASYYLLPRALPGLSSWLARVAFGDPGTGGVQFLLWEAILVGLSASCVTAWTMALMSLRGGAPLGAAARAIATALGVFSFLALHLHGLRIGLSALLRGADLNWWSYSDQIVRYTSNQYPIWLILLGDSHSYAQIIPFQLTLWGLLVLLTSREEVNRGLAGLCGFAAAAVFLAHFPSVAITLVVWGPALALLVLWERAHGRARSLVSLGVNVGSAIVSALLLVLPNWRVAGQTKVTVPPSNVTSPLLQFLDVQFPVLLWIGICLFFLIPWRAMAEPRGCIRCHRQVLEWGIALALFAAFASCLLERPAIGVALSVGIVVALVALVTSGDSDGRTRGLSIALALSVMTLWIFPEVVAIDHTADNRTLWIRFNVVLRFWPEAYYLIPFVVSFSIGGALLRALKERGPRAGFGGLVGAACLAFALSQLPAVWNRDRRSPEADSIDGFRFLRDSGSKDWKLVSYLASLPESPKVRIAEACGARVYPATPSDYAWPGRISAFSGRVAPCGWARHALLFHPRLSNGEDTWASLRGYETAWLRILAEAGASLPKWSPDEKQRFLAAAPILDDALTTFRSLGITHMAYGELERLNFGEIDLAELARISKGAVVLAAGRGIGIVRLDP